LDVALSQPDIHIGCACYIPNLDGEYRFPAAEYAALAKKHNKPAILCLITPHLNKQELMWADECGTPAFNSPHKAGKTLVNLIRLWQLRNHKS
jgi:acyl-CoA synthetase (NDP forming)